LPIIGVLVFWCFGVLVFWLAFGWGLPQSLSNLVVKRYLSLMLPPNANQNTKTPKHQNTKTLKHQNTKTPKHQNTKTLKH
jgi:hypothetical protein